jgi:hypothetical protein
VAKKQDEALSMPALIKALGEGDTYSRSKRVPVGSKEAKDLNVVIGKLRNVVNQCVSRLRKETGSNFRVESGIALTSDNTAHICIVAVTRMDDEDNEEVDI